VHAVNEAGPGDPATKTGVHTVAAPKVSITGVNANTHELVVNLSVEDGGGDAHCAVTVTAPGGSGHGGNGTGCDSVTIGNLYAGKPFTVSVTVSNVAGDASASRGAKTDRIQGYVNCTDDPSKPPPADTYCQGNAGRNPGVGIYPQPSQSGSAAYSRNHAWIDAVCRASGTTISSAWYNHYKGASSWWVRLGDGNYIPFTWFNLGSSGGSGVGEPIEVLGDC
jgi:hypothetical protein